MRTGLGWRILYGAAGLLLAGGGGFTLTMLNYMWLQPRMRNTPMNESEEFNYFVIALGVGVVAGVTAAMVGLTLPWRRRRTRHGRWLRTVVAMVLVAVATAGVKVQGFSMAHTAVFAVWLVVLVTFTFVRYGVFDRPQRRRMGQGIPPPYTHT